jgi:hypothetical protein
MMGMSLTVTGNPENHSPRELIPRLWTMLREKRADKMELSPFGEDDYEVITWKTPREAYEWNKGLREDVTIRQLGGYLASRLRCYDNGGVYFLQILQTLSGTRGHDAAYRVGAWSLRR